MKITYSYYGKLANIVSLKESEKLKNGYLCFYRNNLADFPYQFTALEKGDFMFMNTGYHKMPNDEKCEEFKVVLSEKDYLLQKSLKEEETGTPPSSSSEEGKDYLITADCFPVLTSGYYMFAYSDGLNTIQQNFPKLENGERMFYYTKSLAYFDYIASEEPIQRDNLKFHDQTEVPKHGYYVYAADGFEYLNTAYEMFAHSNLTSFYRDLPKLENANYMFSYATKLTYLNFADEFGKFDYDTSSFYGTPPEGEPKGYEYPYIKTANYMFQATNVTHFYRHLPKVEECIGMFAGSKLTYLQCGGDYSFLGSENSDIKPNCKDIFKTINETETETGTKRDLYIGSRPWVATPESLETMFKDCKIHNWVSNWCYIDATEGGFADSIYDAEEYAKRYVGGYTLTAHKIDEWTLYRILYHIGGMIKLSGSTGGTIHLNVADEVIKKYKDICSAHPDPYQNGYSHASAAYYVTAILKWGFPNHTFTGNVSKTDTSLLRVHDERLDAPSDGDFPWLDSTTSTFDLANEEPPTTSIVSEETTTQMWGLN